MPWTVAHPAAVLPLRKLGLKHLSFRGLVVGSVSPDIGYYVGRFDLAAIAHTALGLLILCLPTGLALFALVRVLHRPVANLLPEPHRSALLSVPQAPRLTSAPIVLAVAVSIVLGAMTHNVWDSFTHSAGYMVSKLPLLRVGVIGTGGVRAYELLQHASTLVGLIVVVVAYVTWLKRVEVSRITPRLSGNRWRYTLLLALLAGSVILAAMVSYEISRASGKANVAVMVIRLVICATSIFAIALSVVSLLVWGRGRKV